MVGQDDDGIDAERGGGFCCAKGGTQGVATVNEHRGPAVSQRDREEVSAARDVVPPIAHHGLRPQRCAIVLPVCGVGKLVTDVGGRGRTDMSGAKLRAGYAEERVNPGFTRATVAAGR